MAMPVTVTIAKQNEADDEEKYLAKVDEVFVYFNHIDQTFSPFITTSEISLINQKNLEPVDASIEVQNILNLCEISKLETNGYFNVYRNGKLDPSGIVKGWAIYQGAEILKKAGFENYYVEIAGDIQVSGHPDSEPSWKIGIRSPFNFNEIIKIVYLNNEGIATSGSYMLGNHIYNSVDNQKLNEIVSLTVIGPNVYEADRFATAAFAMGSRGIEFIENYPGLEGFAIDHTGIATMTTSFEKFTKTK